MSEEKMSEEPSTEPEQVLPTPLSLMHFPLFLSVL